MRLQDNESEPLTRVASCGNGEHLWGDPYSFGGVTWYRECLRCFEDQRLERPKRPQSGVFPLHGKVLHLPRAEAKTGSGG